MSTLVCIDSSGSTSGNSVYHELVRRICAKYGADTQYALWSTSWLDARTRNLNMRMPTIDEYCNRRQWNSGGTDPSLIAKHLSTSGFTGRLVIITDGEVDTGSVQRCDKLANAFKHEMADIVIIPTSSRSINFSVAAPFTRNRPFTLTTYDRSGQEVVSERISVDPSCLELLRNLNAPDTFETVLDRFDDIEAAIAAAVVGTNGNKTLVTELLALQKRILAHEAAARGGTTTENLTAAVRAGNVPVAIRYARHMYNEYHDADSATAMTLQSRLSRLVAMCQGKDQSMRLRGLNTDRVQRAASVEAEDVDALPDSHTILESRFECPVMCDDEKDMLVLIQAGPGLLEDLDAGLADRLVQFPLSALNNDDVMKAIANRVDHVVSLSAARGYFEATGDSLAISPMTRAALVGAIALGPDAAHAKASDYTIAQILYSGAAKQLGNLDLWCYVILKAIESKAYLANNVALKERMDEHMRWRLRSRSTFASLTGLPNCVITRVPLDVAIWWVCNAPVAVLAIDSKPTTDPLRAHVHEFKHLSALAELAGLVFAPQTAAHAERLRCMLHMLSMSKHTTGPMSMGRSGTKILDDTVRGLYQASLQINGRPLFIDGPSTKTPQDTPWPSLDTRTIIALRKCVSPQFSASDIALPVAFCPQQVPTPVVEWPFMDVYDPNELIDVCPATMRPWYNLPSGDTWRDAATRVYNVDYRRVLPGNKFYIEFVQVHERYPATVEEYLKYMYTKVTARETIPHTTLPANAVELANSIMNDYSRVIKGVTPTEFNRRTIVSCEIEARVRIENQWKRVMNSV